MRGADTITESLFTMRTLDQFVRAQHSLREIRKTANEALGKLSPMLTSMYATAVKGGHPSIAPESLLRAMLLQVLSACAPISDCQNVGDARRWPCRARRG